MQLNFTHLELLNEAIDLAEYVCDMRAQDVDGCNNDDPYKPEAVMLLHKAQRLLNDLELDRTRLVLNFREASPFIQEKQ